jgi:spore germination protein KC
MSRRLARRLVVAAVLASAGFLTGCWGARELDKTALVLALGIDAARQGPGFRVTAVIARPELLVGGGGGLMGGGGGGGAAGGAAQLVWSAEGATLQEARARLNESLPRHVTLEKTRVVVVGEEAARRSLPQVVDFLTRSFRLPETDRVLVARGTAEAILRSPPLENRTIDEELMDLVIRGVRLRAMTWDGDVITVTRGLSDAAQAALTGAVEPLPGGTGVRLAGSALLARGRLAGWLGPEETRGLAFVRSRVLRRSFSLPCPGGAGSVGVDTRSGRGRVIPRLDGGTPSVDLRVDVTAILSDRGCPTDLESPEGVRRLAAALATAVRREVQAAVRGAQAADADVLGFAGAFHRRYTREWDRGLGSAWPTVFPRLPVRVDVRARITGTGIMSGPPVVR